MYVMHCDSTMIIARVRVLYLCLGRHAERDLTITTTVAMTVSARPAASRAQEAFSSAGNQPSREGPSLIWTCQESIYPGFSWQQPEKRQTTVKFRMSGGFNTTTTASVCAERRSKFDVKCVQAGMIGFITLQQSAPSQMT